MNTKGYTCNEDMEWKEMNSTPKLQAIKFDKVNACRNMPLDSISTFSSLYVMDIDIELSFRETYPSPIKSRNKCNPNTVRFAPIHQVVETISRQDYAKEEAQNTWYSQYEYSQRIRTMDRAKNKRVRRQNILGGWMAVHKEQQRQRKLNLNDPELIAVAYSFASQNCCNEAYKMALWNELEIWDF
jgi:hypothetical protein